MYLTSLNILLFVPASPEILQYLVLPFVDSTYFMNKMLQKLKKMKSINKESSDFNILDITAVTFQKVISDHFGTLQVRNLAFKPISVNFVSLIFVISILRL